MVFSLFGVFLRMDEIFTVLILLSVQGCIFIIFSFFFFVSRNSCLIFGCYNLNCLFQDFSFLVPYFLIMFSWISVLFRSLK